MRELNKSTHWEEFFIQEALELEEKMKTLDVDSLNKSKLRICLEHGILDWAQYEKWYTSQVGVSSIKSSIASEEIEKFVQYAQAVEMNFSQYDFWGADLIPLTVWDNQLIVLGLQYNEQLVKLGGAIFILTPPEVLSSIRRKMADQKIIAESAEEIQLESDDEINDALEGLNFNQAAPKISFTLIQPPSAPTAEKTAVTTLASLETANAPVEDSIPEITIAPAVSLQDSAAPSVIPVTPVVAAVEIAPSTPQTVVAPAAAIPASVQPSKGETPPPPPGTDTPQPPSLFTNVTSHEQPDGVWDFIAERHQEYSFEIKKQFDAFVVLKIANNKTRVFKMDADMTRQNVNQVIFEYNLENEGPFKRIFESRRSDVFTLTQLDMFLYDYQHACITPLVRGEKVVGFFVGFKKNALSQQDKTLLEELAHETAS